MTTVQEEEYISYNVDAINTNIYTQITCVKTCVANAIKFSKRKVGVLFKFCL